MPMGMGFVIALLASATAALEDASMGAGMQMMTVSKQSGIFAMNFSVSSRLGGCETLLVEVHGCMHAWLSTPLARLGW